MASTELTLYELAGADPSLRFSPHCWKTRMALAHKGLETKGIPWRFADRDSALAGHNLVPVLLDGTEIIGDSWRIAKYLEAHYPALPSLFGADAGIPLCHFVNSWADTTLVPALGRIILLDIYNCLDSGDREYFRTSREKRFGMPLEAVVADQPARIQELRKALQPLRQMLKTQSFIGGDAPTYADYAVFGMFMWARCASRIELLLTDDSIFAWRERLLDAFGGVARSAPTAGN